MSLNYYYTDVVNAHEVMFETREDAEWMRPDTQSIIFTTMSIGMGSITEENWLEFYARMHIIEKMGGYTHIPPSRVKEHIGLSTNVNYEPRGKWLRRWFDYELNDIMMGARRECLQES